MDLWTKLYPVLWVMMAPIRWCVLCIMSIQSHHEGSSSFGIFGKLLFIVVLAYSIVYLGLVAYVRITHPVWSRLPAFHVYNLLRGWWWFPPGVLSFDYTSKEHTLYQPYSTWYQEDYIKYRVLRGEGIDEHHPETIRDVLSLLSRNYSSLNETELIYTPKKEGFCSTLTHPDSRIGVVYGDRLPSTRGLRPLLGCITFHPLRVRYRRVQSKGTAITTTSIHSPSSKDTWKALRVMYIDNLCIKRDSRGKGMFSKLCYTSIVRMMRDRDTQTYPIHLFKREGGHAGTSWKALGVIPAWQTVAYGTTLGRLKKVFKNRQNKQKKQTKRDVETPHAFQILPRSFRIQQANIQQIQDVFRRLQVRTIQPKSLLITPEYSALHAMLNKNVWIHVLMDEVAHQAIAMYAWRLTEMMNPEKENKRKNGENNTQETPILELVASVWLGDTVTHPLYFSGFRESLGVCAKQLGRSDGKVFLYDCSDTTHMIRELLQYPYQNKENGNDRFMAFTEQCPITWSWLGFAVPTIPKEQVVVIV